MTDKPQTTKDYPAGMESSNGLSVEEYRRRMYGEDCPSFSIKQR